MSRFKIDIFGVFLFIFAPLICFVLFLGLLWPLSCLVLLTGPIALIILAFDHPTASLLLFFILNLNSFFVFFFEHKNPALFSYVFDRAPVFFILQVFFAVFISISVASYFEVTKGGVL